MKAITVELSEPEFERIAALARQTQRQPQDVVREAIQNFTLVSAPRVKTHSLLDIEPVSVGEILKPWSSRAELLEDFFDRD